MESQVKGAFFGAAIGDALGVPVEFKSRTYLQNNPVKDFIGYGTWNQPPGTFSDDSSLLFCTAESLCNGFDLDDIGNRFARWYRSGYWGAHNQVFDIGNATSGAIDRLMGGISPSISGGVLESNNGNGSLMRILPIAFYLQNDPSAANRFETVKQLSGITHQHFRSVMSCFIYTELAIELLNGADKQLSYLQMQAKVNDFISGQSFAPNELHLFDRVLHQNIAEVEESAIRSSGYVVDTLESSLWCFLRSVAYEDAVLTAVNLGGDTDTTATVTGGLAGIYYGYEAIPTRWIEGIARKKDIAELAERFAKGYQ